MLPCVHDEQPTKSRLNNRPPGVSVAGIQTAVSGFYPLLSNGVNVGAASIVNYPDSAIHQAQPRTAFGVSQDRRYLFLMTLDGRQDTYSQGSLDVETAFWLFQFARGMRSTWTGAVRRRCMWPTARAIHSR